MHEPPVSDAVLRNAAKNLLSAPVRGAAPGARFVEPSDVVCIVADDKTRRIAESIRDAIAETGATPSLLFLERPDNKPLKVLPPQVRSKLAVANSVIFAARALAGERSLREQLAAVVKARGVRHARLSDVSEAAFASGLAIDPRVVLELGRKVGARLDLARALEVTSAAGTKLRVVLSPGGWVERLGEIVPGATVAFPAGALFTSPESIDGVFVADASVGEFFGAREGVLSGRPIRFEIERGRVVGAHAPHSPALEADLRATLAFADNSNRVGLVSVGVNAGMNGPTGDANVDQNLPGLHLGFGDPSGKSTNVGWKARTAFAACETSCRVVVEGGRGDTVPHGGTALVDGGRLVDMG